MTDAEIDQIIRYVCCPYSFAKPGPEKQALCIKLLQNFLKQRRELKKLREAVNGLGDVQPCDKH